MILDPNGMPILQPAVDNAETATFNTAFAAIGNARAVKTYKWANLTARGLQTGMSAGDMGYQTDTSVYYTYAGASWVVALSDTGWLSYTPSLVNFTLGNGTLNGRYRKSNKSVQWSVTLVLGSTSTVSVGPRVSLPVTANDYSTPTLGVLSIFQSGVGTSLGALTQWSTSQVGLSALNAAGTYLAPASISSTVPWTWGSGDTITIGGTYESST